MTLLSQHELSFEVAMPLKITEWRGLSPPSYKHDLTGIVPAKRMGVWRELMRDRLMEVGRSDRLAELEGSIEGQAFRGGFLARWDMTSQELLRTRYTANRLDDEYVFVSALLSGHGIHEQDGVSIDMAPGDFIVVDATHPFSSVTSSPRATKAFLHVRKSALVERLGSRREMPLGIFRGGAPLQKLAFSFLTNLSDVIGHADANVIAALAGQSLDLVALLADESRPVSVDPSTHQNAMLLRLKLQVRANLRDAGLTLEAVAAALGISPRYVNTLFALEETSFGRYLLRQRLEGARRDIMDPRRLHRQIGEIAFDWGFVNVSHFGRAFKDRYGMTPRDAKIAGAVSAIRSFA